MFLFSLVELMGINMVNSSIDKLAAYSYTSLVRADQLLFARVLLIGGIVAASVPTRPSMRVFHRLLNWHVGFQRLAAMTIPGQ